MTSETQPTLVCFAVRAEARHFHASIGKRGDILTLVTGMGPQNARQAISQALTDTRPKLVLTCGFAGGLDPGLAAGAVVFSAEATSDLAAKLRALGARSVRFHCASAVATTAREKQALRQRTGADAVEMESGIIEAVCHDRGVPSATVRVILDTAGEDLPLDFNRLLDENQRLDGVKLAAALAGSPGKIPAMLRLRRRTQGAGEALAKVLAGLLVPAA